MKKIFLVAADIEAARGEQFWYAEAETKAEAIDIVNNGGGTFYEEEVEVTSLGGYFHAGELDREDVEKIEAVTQHKQFSFRGGLPFENGSYLAMWPGREDPVLTDCLFYDGVQYIGDSNGPLVSVHEIYREKLPKFLVSQSGKFVSFTPKFERHLIPDWACRVSSEVVHNEYGEPEHGKSLGFFCRWCGALTCADNVKGRRSSCPACGGNDQPKVKYSDADKGAEGGQVDFDCKDCGFRLEVGNLPGSTITIRCPQCKSKVQGFQHKGGN